MPSAARTHHRPFAATAAAAGTALAAVVLLGGCGTGSPTPGPETTTASAQASGSPSASATATSTSTATGTVGALVAGFPTTLLPLMPGATLKSTIFDATGAKATASMVAATTATQEGVLAFYTKALGDQGFTPLPGDAVGSIASKDFTRANGTELVSLSMVPENGTVTFTLSANVLPASLK
ncbi:hypothetical protein [Arthrobacter sp. 35W]|uniref:hypothetical protein n=1 Tax=Arthrobacter sp. 35W TaxID=1132441 RepID=UPI00040D2332|nr:hypothetical protein [Arthrobacter sp. 35W]